MSNERREEATTESAVSRRRFLTNASMLSVLSFFGLGFFGPECESDTEQDLSPALVRRNARAFAGCHLYNSVSQPLTSGVEVRLLSFDSEVNDAGGFHNRVSQTDRITIPKGLAGYYLVQALIYWEATEFGGVRETLIKHKKIAGGHSFYYGGLNVAPTDGNVGESAVYPPPIYCAEGDFLQCYGYQESGHDLDARGGEGASLFGCVWMGDKQ